MKTEQMLEKMGDIAPEFVEEAAPRKRRSPWGYVSAAAAALVLVLGVGLALKTFVFPGADSMEGDEMPHSAESAEQPESAENTGGLTGGVGAEVDGATFPGDDVPHDAEPSMAPGAPGDNTVDPNAGVFYELERYLGEALRGSEIVFSGFCTAREGLTARMEPKRFLRGEAEGELELALPLACGEDTEPYPGEECVVFACRADDGAYKALAVVCRGSDGVSIPGVMSNGGVSFEDIIEYVERNSKNEAE